MKAEFIKGWEFACGFYAAGVSEDRIKELSEQFGPDRRSGIFGALNAIINGIDAAREATYQAVGKSDARILLEMTRNV